MSVLQFMCSPYTNLKKLMLLFFGDRCPTISPFFLSCRRLEPSERPLQMVYEYLTAMGYTDPVRVQQEAANSDLSCLIRFYSGKY